MDVSKNIDALTPREREILVYVAEGLSLYEIAQKLSRSPKTIESHRLAIGRKLNAPNRVALTRIAIANGLVSVDDQGAGKENDPEQVAPEQELAWLDEITQALHGTSGHGYIEALCDSMSRVLGLRISGVCISAYESGQDKRFTVAFSERGECQPRMLYDMTHTPVPKALEQGVVRVTENMPRDYPESYAVSRMGIRSYLALRLDGDFGGATGVFSVMHDGPIRHAKSVERVMRFFLDRTSAELAIAHRDNQIAALKRQLNRGGPMSEFA